MRILMRKQLQPDVELTIRVNSQRPLPLTFALEMVGGDPAEPNVKKAVSLSAVEVSALLAAAPFPDAPQLPTAALVKR